jgi:hypothetical protein
MSPKRTGADILDDCLAESSPVLGPRDCLADNQLVGHPSVLPEYIERGALRGSNAGEQTSRSSSPLSVTMEPSPVSSLNHLDRSKVHTSELSPVIHLPNLPSIYSQPRVVFAARLLAVEPRKIIPEP